jgi:hypothetical protein
MALDRARYKIPSKRFFARWKFVKGKSVDESSSS